MANEKLSEGIRKFAEDIEKLEKIIYNKLIEAWILVYIINMSDEIYLISLITNSFQIKHDGIHVLEKF